MAKLDLFQRAKTPVATSRRRDFNFQDEHITTSDFCQVNVAKAIRLNPKSKIDINLRAFARLSPLSVPTFGRANMNIRAFFVPYRVIWSQWNDFITDSPHTDDSGSRFIPSSCPQIDNACIVSALIQDSTVVTGSPTKSQYDFITNITGSVVSPVVNETTYTYYKLNDRGARTLKVLHSLGYRPQFMMSFNGAPGSGTANPLAQLTFNALPLLSFLRVFCDWYWPSQYTSNSIYNLFMQYFTANPGSTIVIQGLDCQNMLRYITTFFYDADYFTAAFDNPLGPSSNTFSSVSMADPTSLDSLVRTSLETQPNGTPVLKSVQPNGTSNFFPANLSLWANSALHSLSDYLHRHQLAGSRALDRFLARFGVSLPSDKLNRSIYLGNHEIPLMTGDVMGTAEVGSSLGSTVGSFAGKGFLAGKDGHFQFETNEYGLFLLTYSIVPHIGYYQGAEKGSTYKGRLDFFTPEFDGLYNRAIAKSELFVPQQEEGNAANAFDNVFDTIFGFIPQYAEDKVPHDIVSGDFQVPTRSYAGFASNSWHLMRDVSNNFNTSNDIVHAIDFLDSAKDMQDYKRIFQFNLSSGNNPDHFSIHFFFGYSINAPMLPLFDNYDWEEEGKKLVNLHINGSKVD